jgi:hypothetical protein
VDCVGVFIRGQAHQIPGGAEVGPVDADLGVKPDLAVALDGRRGIDEQGRVRARTVNAPVTATL